MRKTMMCLLGLGLVVSAGAFAEDDDGWVSLFNGKDLTGWVQLNGTAKYTVEDGALVGTSVPKSPNSFLCSEKEYGDFILEFEFMGHSGLNSGCQIRSISKKSIKDGRVHGYQCELENEGQERDWSCGIYDEARRGWLFPKKDNEEQCKAFSEQGKKLWKNGEWNQVRIECKGDHIQTWLNGELRADFHDDMTLKGILGLQVHGVGDRTEPMSVRWRNIRIKELDK